ncbi:MAG: bifunctional oligoribonuclease/PAP phosphatase NrnA [Clostridium celatum]|uniref:DHH family phosphoesterase n=1 Tax=uncultured Clostridium sp. TaxID=59620 RepID=UPI0025DC563D|nr:bifunctional oligoribonuclease/PAP phosphatase NrnA [uncultured Clostridium sp.]MBS6184777.1 bifunctional oligoribonuclease/PAP phosphatase NrnA [Clostridium celatum]MDU2122111.1 bifunctional oligoribonuclease/PAP phosphatase NrnA [Clostridium celatum]MDU4882908.1 bifunctional oligoribonuclease/PAP phosphatase NrnA [Clostridium celatum]MDU4979971.1 bifunctional oligoribonuclease/PAP phosphatase NrnA [Clostridium celatum]MDU5262868.1 bifunctional oligoribonuclease/PAP phosphatase NrnA [Clost
MTLSQIAKFILESKKIGITYHVSPDGDAVGSVLALFNALKSLNKDCYIISKDTLSENLKFLKGSDEITGEITEPVDETDIVVVLDCGNLERVSANLKEFTGTIVNIDHHLSNDKYGDINYIDSNAAATAEIVFELLNLMGISFEKEDSVIKDIGTCMYTSIVTDTGAYRHSNVTERTHKISAVLKKIGVDNTFIYQSLFDNKDFSRIKLIGKALSSMQLILNGKVALLEIDKNFTADLGIDVGDTSDIISYGLQIKGVEVTLLLKEVEDGVKASLRAKSYVDVRKIAEVFGGGGHIRASGIKIKNMSMEEAKYEILNEIQKEL